MYSNSKIARIVIKKILAKDSCYSIPNCVPDFSIKEINLGKMVHWQLTTEEERRKRGYFEYSIYYIYGLTLGFRFIEMSEGNDTLLNRIMSEGEKNNWWGLELLSYIIEVNYQGENESTTKTSITVFKLNDDQREIFAKPLVVREVQLQFREEQKKV